MNRNRLWPLAALACLAPSPARAAPPLIEILSSKPAFVTGGDALVRISGATGLVIKLNGTDISNQFAPAGGNALMARVTGFGIGPNTLTVERPRATRTLAAMTLTNYPITGPILSGPQLTPFICSTADFKLPSGDKLGNPIDAACSIAPRTDYVYMATGASELKPLPSLEKLPDDVAMTTTIAGATVRFIVRIDTATVNRGIYQSAILSDPFADQPP
ncbi:MAG: hypothetical protein JWR77_2710, partial [Rhizorhabdus sp.]|nr:hypothetical protein [Rhizorhabdus sp.]